MLMLWLPPSATRLLMTCFASSSFQISWMSLESKYAALSVGAAGAADGGLAAGAWAKTIGPRPNTATAAAIAILRMCFTPSKQSGGLQSIGVSNETTRQG